MSEPIHGDPAIDQKVIQSSQNALGPIENVQDQVSKFIETLQQKSPRGKPYHENISHEISIDLLTRLCDTKAKLHNIMSMLENCTSLCHAAVDRTMIQKLKGHIGATKDKE